MNVGHQDHPDLEKRACRACMVDRDCAGRKPPRVTWRPQNLALIGDTRYTLNGYTHTLRPRSLRASVKDVRGAFPDETDPMRLHASVPLAIALLLCTTTLAAAQMTPGYRGDRDEVLSEFRAKTLNEFQAVLGAWVRAVNDGDVDAASELYAADAFIHLDGASGPGEVRAVLEEWLRAVPELRVGLSDFDVSGELAYGSVRVQLLDSGSAPPTDGIMAIVMRRHGRDWRIRSQVIVTTLD